MEARKLWRVRLGVFILVFLLTMFVPIYFYQLNDNYGVAMFSFDPMYFGNISYTFNPQEILFRVLQFVFTSIMPSIFLVMGIIGCVLTKRDVMKSEKVSKAARLLTQIAVTAILFAAITDQVSNLMGGIYISILSLISPGTNYIQTIYVNSLVILPFALFLAYISYDFSRFRALDFKQEAPTFTREPPEQPPINHFQEIGISEAKNNVGENLG